MDRKVVRSAQRRNQHLSQEPSVVEFNRLHRALGTFSYGAPIAEPEPSRIKPSYKPPTEKEEELAKLEVAIRQWEIKCAEEASGQRLLKMYGASDFFCIDEMSKNGELEIWLIGRFGTADFSRIDGMLKSGEYGDRKEKGYDGDQHNPPASSSTCVVGILSGDMPTKSKARNERSETDPSSSSNTRPVLMREPPKSLCPGLMKAPPMGLLRIDEGAGSSASLRVGPTGDLPPSAPGGDSESEHTEEFRAGGAHRTPTSPKIRSAKSDGANSLPSSSASDVFPSPSGSTVPTAETERPSFNPTFGDIPPECASYVHGPDVLCPDPSCPCEQVYRRRLRNFSMYREPDRVYRSMPPSIMGSGDSEQESDMRGASVMTRMRGTAVDSDWNTCASATNDGASSREYPTSYRGTPYELATSKSVPRMPPPRDYRWNLIGLPP